MTGQSNFGLNEDGPVGSPTWPTTSIDRFGRTPISDAVQKSIRETFEAIPEGKRGALLVVADEHGARMMVAAKLGEHWKVAAGAGKPWDGPVSGSVVLQGTW